MLALKDNEEYLNSWFSTANVVLLVETLKKTKQNKKICAMKNRRDTKVFTSVVRKQYEQYDILQVRDVPIADICARSFSCPLLAFNG